MIQSNKWAIYVGTESLNKIKEEAQIRYYLKLITINMDSTYEKQLVLVEQINAKSCQQVTTKQIKDTAGLMQFIFSSPTKRCFELMISNTILKELVGLKIMVEGNVEKINQSILKLCFIKIQLPTIITTKDQLQMEIIGIKFDPNRCLDNNLADKSGYSLKDSGKIAEILHFQLAKAIKIYEYKDWKSAHRFIVPFCFEMQLQVKILNIRNPSFDIQPLSASNNSIYSILHLQSSQLTPQHLSKEISRTSLQLLTLNKNDVNECRWLSFAPRKIYNPHIFIKTSKKQKCLQYYTKGIYEYYHYSDQNFNDQGWGCAYRSLQTILSWLYIQNHLKISSVPSLTKIQQLIDRINIGSNQKLKGTQEWIGATEVSWVIKKLTNYDCRIIHVSDGNQIIQNCQTFREHFEKVGCPIMYGGGQYAYSIVGMNYSWKLGECEFLILDPHYNGPDNIDKIFQKKGVCWRKPDQMFKKGIFYNFCLPLI